MCSKDGWGDEECSKEQGSKDGELIPVLVSSCRL
jgi:hypothetical protein